MRIAGRLISNCYTRTQSPPSLCPSVSLQSSTFSKLWPRNFIFGRCRIYRSSSYTKVIGSRSRSQEQKSASVHVSCSWVDSWIERQSCIVITWLELQSRLQTRIAYEYAINSSSLRADQVMDHW